MHCSDATAGDKLLEACYHGDLNAVKELVENGVDINFVNKVNKWTALHWAVSKANVPMVQYLVNEGASGDLENSKGQKPIDLSTSQEIDSVLSPSGQAEQNRVRKSEFCKESIREKYGFVPSFVNYPQNVSASRDCGSMRDTVQNKSREICIRARISEAKERDFIELDIDLYACSFQELQTILCRELRISTEVRKVRKLPNTIIRNDRDVQRLVEGSEIELVLEYYRNDI